jgi:glutamate 5-kinase
MNQLLEFGIVPIINENDTVAVDEIRVGDNDTLAAEVALLVDADVAVILSDVEGLYTADPRQDPHASLIPLVESITEDIERLAGGSVSFEGTGGMATKIRAAKMATAYGIATLILNGATPGLLGDVFEGKAGGTFFTPRPRKLNSRKHWIAFTLRAKGQLVLDAGAIEALTRRGKSLLASGIREVIGDFVPGDALTCLDEQGKEIAKGLVNFSSDSLKLIKGRKTTEIQAILGATEYEEVIHRDNMVILSTQTADR